MAERGFLILKHVQRAPRMATCEACHIKFFIPMELVNDPQGAEEHLRQKYADHTCRPLVFSHAVPKGGQ